MAQKPDAIVEVVSMRRFFETVAQRAIADDHCAHFGLNVLQEVESLQEIAHSFLVSQPPRKHDQRSVRRKP